MDPLPPEQHRKKPLRIAMVVPPWFSLPPAGYGGLEEVCTALVDALVDRGHSVTLFGAGPGTGTKARFVSTVPDLQAERLGQGLPELAHVVRVNHLLEEEDFDIIHDNTQAGLLTVPQRRAPTVATVHGSPTGDMGAFLSGVDRSCALIAISHSQRRLGAGLPWSATIYHGLAYKGPQKQEPATGPALWLARFNPDKGPDLAMQACTKAGIEVVLAGKAVEDVEKRYLEEVIRPMSADHPCAKLVVNPDRKYCQELMMQARCLLLPVCWEEPFGMVLLEAMTTGTPVVALSRGAIPEVIVHGKTGFVCDSPDEMPDALREVSTLDPRISIDHVTENFSAEAMARRYEAVYHRWAATGSSARARHTLSPVSTFASSQRVA